jgi:hypothetical protein
VTTVRLLDPSIVFESGVFIVILYDELVDISPDSSFTTNVCPGFTEDPVGKVMAMPTPLHPI